jgi:hypothetical protein
MMIGDQAALKVAIDLLHLPSRASHLRSDPLPAGVVMLLRIASGDAAATAEGVQLSGRSPEIIRDAAAFYIEQILLFPGASSYRILGASQNATAAEIRRNMACLLTWLHPDVNRSGGRSVFAGRVTRAWEDLKTPERRAVYDRVQLTAGKARARSRNIPKHAKSLPSSRLTASHGKNGSGRGNTQQAGLLRRFLLVLFGRIKRKPTTSRMR